ncbi:hypothetical protein [Paenibacillus sp. DYY-L-2]|uniref:hypothetical protein n=1 Tax=Paenibacillus sp. DYY-L-2 TaxID=3447013 RepID=UPI003F504817
MHITIEDNNLVYIYLKEQQKYVENCGGESSVQCYLIYDQNGNWIGVKITNKDTDGNVITLPRVGAIDYPIYSGEVIELENEIILSFEKDKEIMMVKEQDCNLDIHPDGIFGIEMILWTGNNITQKEMVKPFIKRDI